jgi:hypothetical protein
VASLSITMSMSHLQQYAKGGLNLQRLSEPLGKIVPIFLIIFDKSGVSNC